MKRAWATSNAALNEEGQVCPNPSEGDDRAQEVALALAAISDVDFLRSVLNGKAAMDQFGGQLVIAADRKRIDGHGRLDPEGAERVTIAFVHSYQHVADALKDSDPESDRKPHQVELGPVDDDPPFLPEDESPEVVDTEPVEEPVSA